MEKKSIVLIGVLAVIIPSLGADLPVPPPLWCENASLAGKVGVLDQCKAYNDSASDKKIKVTLLYESLCPDCQILIKDVLYPQVWKFGKDFIDLELIPYGNARHTAEANGSYHISCQHGPVECKLNKLHSCVINQLDTVSRWFPFIYCMEVSISGGQDPDRATKQCYTQLGIKATEQAKITECTQGPQGDQLQKIAADKTDAILPEKHQFVPWILFNDVSLQKAQYYQNALFGALCDWYRGKQTPQGCSEFMRATRKNKCVQ
jgi:interferon gamma-inducible protein 30